MSISIISAIYGGCDTVKPVMAQTVDVDEWIMVTDNANLEAPGWRVVCETRPYLHPCMAAKWPKFLPGNYSNSFNTLWVDASFTYAPTMAQMALEGLQDSPFSLFPHPHRTSIVAEAALSRTLPKYDALPMEEQVAHYLKQGYPDTHLWATGVLATNATWRSSNFGKEWLNECLTWGYQDQLSFPYLVWKSGWTPYPIGESQFTSPHVHLGPHL